MEEREARSEADFLVEDMRRRTALALDESSPSIEAAETGVVERVGGGVVGVRGLDRVASDELVAFPGGALGMALDLGAQGISVAMLTGGGAICAGMEARRTRSRVEVAVGGGLVGRVVDPLGRALDRGGPVVAEERYAIERPAHPIMDRAPVSVPLQTGILAIDALVPIGRGQRELIVGDRQLGKTAVAVDTIINQAGKGVYCVYCSIGQQSSQVARVVAVLRERGAMDHCSVVVASGDDTPGMNFIAPYAATSMAEYFMERGEDALVVYDDLSRHARSYRELSLLMRRPPAREAFPGDIFYIHSRLLERSTHLVASKGGGSMTALPVVETEAQNIAAYIPTNLVSITDGQIYLTPRLFDAGILPPVDVGRSVSRVGGKAQLPAYRSVAASLRLSYAQFEELELFERFSSRLDQATLASLARGRRIREALRQEQYAPIPVAEQLAVLVAVVGGALDGVQPEGLRPVLRGLRSAFAAELGGIASRIVAGEGLAEAEAEAVRALARRVAAGAGRA